MKHLDRATSVKIDNMRFVCACLVVAVHTRWPLHGGSWWEWLVRILLNLSVPFFFISSGYFLARKFEESGWWLKAVGKRCRSLGIPYAVWLAAALLVALGCERWLGVLPYSKVSEMYPSLRILLGLNPFFYPGLHPLWYLRTLFVLVLLAPLLKWAVDRLGWWIIALLMIVHAIFCGYVQAGLQCVPGSWAIFMFFWGPGDGPLYFLVGMCLCRVPLNPSLVARSGGVAVPVLAVLLLLLMVTSGAALVQGVLYAVAIPTALAILWRLMPVKPMASWLAGCAFPIYLIHDIVFIIYDTLIWRLGIDSEATAGLWLRLASGVLAPMGVFLTLRRVIPSVTKVIFGGRG